MKFTTLALILISAASFAPAATLVTSGSSPLTDGDDISNLVPDTGGTLIWTDRPMVGNSFDTGASALELSAITLLMTANDSSGDNEGDIDLLTFRIRIGEVVGGTFSEISFEDATLAAETLSGSYFTFNLDNSVNLDAATTYAFQVGVSATNGVNFRNGIPSVRQAGNTFGGGSRFTGDRPNNAPGAMNFSSGNDLVFHLETTAIPEPSSILLFGLAGMTLFLRRRVS